MEKEKKKSVKMEKPNFWKYLKDKLWIILVVNIYVLFFVLPKSLRDVNDFSINLGSYAGVIFMNAKWIGIYYFHYRMKKKKGKNAKEKEEKN